MMRFLKNTTFVIWLLCSFATLALSTSVWALSQSIRVAALTKTVAAQAVQNRKRIARLKAKARMRRVVMAVPVAGIAAGGYFEEKDRRAWLASNPGSTSMDYACEMASLSTEVMDEVLADLPLTLKLPSWAIPKCDNS